MTDNDIRQIHDSGWAGVIVVTGGGATAISRLLSVPGGSRSVLSATVPYSSASLIEWLGRTPESFCSSETARAMAAVACHQARRLAAADNRSETLFGLSCTASLASDRPKRGAHRAHLVLHSLSCTRGVSLVFDKGARDRRGEEELLSELILNLLAQGCGARKDISVSLRPADELTDERVDADPLLIELIESRRPVVWSMTNGSFQAALPDALWPESSATKSSNAPRRGVLCGSFHPLHAGHQELRRVASLKLGGPVYYELSVHNVDKPPLDYLTIDARRRQFQDEPLAFTCAPTFADKSAALPATTFVVGADTAERIVDPRYYGGTPVERDRALDTIREHGCRFLVAGRKSDEGQFVTLNDISIPEGYATLFEPISPEEFRQDISSTELREAATPIE